MAREWTAQETVLLLQGLEMYKDDWNKICEHVGTRTRNECILHFLRLPIQDPYLDNDCGVLGPLAFQLIASMKIPTSHSANPVMSTVASLAPVVGPRTTAATAKPAMEDLGATKDEIPSSIMGANFKKVKISHFGGKFEPNAGIAGTASEKEEDAENKSSAGGTETGQDKQMKDLGNKEPGKDPESSEASQKDEDSNNSSTERGVSVEIETEKSEDEDAVKTEESSTESSQSTAASTEAANGSNENGEANRELSNEAFTAAAADAGVSENCSASVEELIINSLVLVFLETQMQTLETKLRNFETLESNAKRDIELLVSLRQQLITERLYVASYLEQLRVVECWTRQVEQQGQWQGPQNPPEGAPATTSSASGAPPTTAQPGPSTASGPATGVNPIDAPPQP